MTVENFGSLTSLAQYKNTHHVGDGYFCDTGYEPGEMASPMPLSGIFSHITAIYGVDQPAANEQSSPADMSDKQTAA